jgi:hypothetical protein
LLARLIGFAHLDLLQAAEGVPAQGSRGVSDPEVAAAARGEQAMCQLTA